MNPARVLVLLAIVLAGCRSGPYLALTPTERAPFERCRSHVRPVVCGGDYSTSDIVCATREGDAADLYGGLAPTERAAWLVGHGCPEAVAGYESSRAEAPRAPGERERVSMAAASDHACALGSVVVQAEHPEGFWLLVCDVQRFYRRAGDRFVEQPSEPQ